MPGRGNTLNKDSIVQYLEECLIHQQDWDAKNVGYQNGFCHSFVNPFKLVNFSRPVSASLK